MNINEGGVTRYRGGWRLCVTPAGYLGGAFWAAICTAVLDYRWGMFAVAASLGLALLATLLSLLWTKKNGAVSKSNRSPPADYWTTQI
jgi:hypothetical protein